MSDGKGLILKVVVGSLVVVAVATWSPFADARPVSFWNPKRIVAKAEVLVVAEVLEVTEQEHVAKERNRWKIPLLHMNARIRVKRFFEISGKHTIREAEPITLTYCAIDWENCKAIVNGPNFPDLSHGDIVVFPLRKTIRQGQDSWELIHEEDFGLLTPAVIEQLRLDSEVKTGIAFLRSELAGAFSTGRYETVFKAARYLSHLYDWDKQFEETCKLIARHVGDDQDRWLSIAVACYSAMGMPRPKIGDLPTSAEHRGLQAALAARALGHIDVDGLDDRFIALSMKQCTIHTWGTAVTISVNYSGHPTAIQFLKKALEAPTPEAVYIARYIIKEKGHPLCDAAVNAAASVLTQPDTSDSSGFRAACELIRDYGDEKAFALLLEDIRESQKTDRERYMKLWQACAYTKNRRLIPICRIVIDDRTACSDNLRFCDFAAFTLQRVTGENFGLSSTQTAAERETAIQKARDYLNQ